MMFLLMSGYLPTGNSHKSTQLQNKADRLFDVYDLSRGIVNYLYKCCIITYFLYFLDF